MKCIRPTKFPNSDTHNICGQCLPCRITRRSEWTTKLMLEWQTFREGCFITLTYNNEHLPKNKSLVKTDAQKFIKRFRKYYQDKYGETKIRYGMVGEYGDRYERPHYHALLFNVDILHAEETISRAWKKGIYQVDKLNKNRIKYTVGYTIKKMTHKEAFKDKEPEFFIMSKNPGLGWYTLPRFAQALKKRDLYPTKALTQYQKYILEQEGYQVQPWNGVYHQGKEYYRLDKPMMSKLAQLVRPELKEIAESKEEIFYPKEYKIRKTRLHDNSYFDTIKFVTSEEKDVEEKKAKKKKRQAKKQTF